LLSLQSAGRPLADEEVGDDDDDDADDDADDAADAEAAAGAGEPDAVGVVATAAGLAVAVGVEAAGGVVALALCGEGVAAPPAPSMAAVAVSPNRDGIRTGTRPARIETDTDSLASAAPPAVAGGDLASAAETGAEAGPWTSASDGCGILETALHMGRISDESHRANSDRNSRNDLGSADGVSGGYIPVSALAVGALNEGLAR
jgi:hypothetical protein